jgi:nucleoside-diphosphate-sugar epimerase
MGGGIGRALWLALAARGARRIAGTRQNGLLFCDLQQLSDSDGDWFRPGDVFVFPAAWSKPDQCRKDPEGAWLVNVENTERLIEKALERDTRVIFFSSDTVYGQQDGTLSESAPLLATEEYGKMKAKIERRFASARGFSALRLSYVTSLEDGVTRYFETCVRKGEVAEVFGEYARSMVWIDDVVDAVCALASMAEQGETLPKAVNVGGPACISRVQMAQAYARSANGVLQIADVTAPDGFFSSRPRSIALDVSLLASILGRPSMTLDAAYNNALKGTIHG